MKKLTLFFMYMAVIAIYPSNAQYYYNNNYYESDILYEVGLSAGIMNCLTDIGGKGGVAKKFIGDLNWENTKPCVSLYAAAIYHYALTVGFTATYGSVQAYDSILKGKLSSHGRYERNLSFKSPILEARLSLEAHPIYLLGLYADGKAPRISPYLSGGIGFFRFNPKANYNGKWYKLHKLHTEGQGFPGSSKRMYSLNQITIPVGFGFRYEVSALVNMHLEFIHRILFTDYLDDASTTYADPSLFSSHLSPDLAPIAYYLADRRGELNPAHVPSAGGVRGHPNKDSFFSIQLKAGITFGRKKR